MYKQLLAAPLLLILFCLGSCQYENAEQLYKRNPDTPPNDSIPNDSIPNDTGSVVIGKKIILSIPFNNSVVDESDSQFTIDVYGEPGLTTDRKGDPNSALYLNGEDQFLEIDCGQQDSISVSFWFVCSSGRSNYSSLFDYGANAIRTDIDGYSGPTSFNVTAFYNNLDELNANYNFQYFTWYHIYISACNQPEIYVNGIKTGSIQKNVILNLSTNKLIFGKSVHDDSGLEIYFHGLMDDIKVFNYPLANQQIVDLYEE